MNPKKLTLINFSIVLYFIVLYTLHSYKVDATFIGVLREILTIPLLIGQLVFLVLSIQFLMKKRTRQPLLILSIVSLAICSFFTIQSFI